MTKKQKRTLKRILIAISIFLVVFLSNLILKCFPRFEEGISSIIPYKYGFLLTFGLYFIIYIYIGHDVIKKAILNIIHGHMLDENFLMFVATVGAFSLGLYQGFSGNEADGFEEGCAVLLFYQVGEWFQSYAVSKSRKSISDLMDIKPDYANLYKDGVLTVVSPEEVLVSDVILVKPGERIPLDGIIVNGASAIDTSSLTGESKPFDANTGDKVISGTVNLTQTIEVRVTNTFAQSTVSKILDLVENATSQKSKSENFITKFAKVYTPLVVACALLLAIIPSIITKDAYTWIYRALSFLVVSCPCALVISIPLSFFCGIGGASRNGILIKGSVYLDEFNKASTFVFDKTGTLTKGNFKVTEVLPRDKKDEILNLAAIAEADSNHPIAKSIKEACKVQVSNSKYVLTNISGKGIVAKGEDVIYCGNEKLMEEFNISYTKHTGVGTIVYVAKNKDFVGSILICDEIKDDTKSTISYLNQIGTTIMLTGDNQDVARSVAKEIGVKEYHHSLLPQDKVALLEKIKKNSQGNVVFVGDGINDAPVLVTSDIGVSMGGIGSDAAIEASDVVLMHDDLKSIPILKKIAKKTMQIVYENIIFALGIKLLILVLSALGYASMWLAVIGDVGVAVLAILNATRTNKRYKI